MLLDLQGWRISTLLQPLSVPVLVLCFMDRYELCMYVRLEEAAPLLHPLRCWERKLEAFRSLSLILEHRELSARTS